MTENAGRGRKGRGPGCAGVLLLVVLCLLAFRFCARDNPDLLHKRKEISILSNKPGSASQAEQPQETPQEDVEPVQETIQAPELPELTLEEVTALLEEALDAAQESAELPTRDLDLVKEAVSLLREKAEYFWLGDTVNMRTIGLTGCRVDFNPRYSDVPGKRREVEAAAKAILDTIPPGASDYVKAKTIHDALVSGIEYDVSLEKGTLYDALVGRCCVCEGYAKAFLYLGERAGLEVGYYAGYGENESFAGPHAWNSAVLDGELYYFDVTWDDPQGNEGGGVRYDWFAVTYADMAGSHRPDADHPMRYTNATACSYYYTEGCVLESFSGEDAAALFARPENPLEVLCLDDGTFEAFMSFLQDAGSVSAAVRASGREASAYSLTYDNLRRTVTVRFE